MPPERDDPLVDGAHAVAERRELHRVDVGVLRHYLRPIATP